MSFGYSMGYVEGTEVPVEHLDYGYIKGCQNGSELEKILKILRSGKEGSYPELVATTEKCLKSVKPDSKLLIKTQNITKVTDLPSDEWKTVNSDLQQWEKIITREEDALSNGRHVLEKDIVSEVDTDLPPIRKSGTVTKQKESSSDTKDQKKQAKPVNTDRIKSFDFKSWDKYDVEKEVTKGDETENNKKEESAKNPTSQWNDELTEKEKLMSEIERQKAGQREREKGNEAFRAGDHEEAVAYYTRSIKLYPDSAAFNNRALVCIKLQQYERAVSDCKETLKRDNNNTKALLRIATAYEALKDYQETVEYCELLLKLEPNNKRCQELLNKVRKHYVPDVTRDTNRKGKRITIKEMDKKIDEETEESIKLAATNDQSVTMESHDTKVLKTPSNPSPPGVPTPSPPVVPTPTPPVDTPKQPPPSLPANVQFLKDGGNELFRVGQYGSAVNKYTKAIELLQKEKTDHTHSLSTLYSNRAACHIKNGDCRSCINDSTQSIVLSPLNIKGILRRAMAYETMEKYRNAFVDYKLAIAIDPKNEKALESSSRITRLLKDQDGNNWRDKLPPNADTERVMAALSAYSTKQLDTPITTVTPTTNITTTTPTANITTDTPITTPTDLNIHTVKSDSNQTNSNGERGSVTGGGTGGTGETSGANGVPTDGTSKSGNMSDQDLYEDFKKKGNEFVKQYDYESAQHFYSSCINLSPTQTVAYTNRALCYLKLEKYTDCDTDCSYVLGLEPRNIKALYRRALSRKGQGKYQESLMDLKLVIELDEKNVTAKKEKDVVHDLYLKELRNIQASQPSKDSARNKPVTKGTGQKKASNTGKKDHKSKQPLPNKATPTNITVPLKEKKRKKIIVEEDNGDDDGKKKADQQSTGKKGDREPPPVFVPPAKKINLHDVKPLKGDVSHLIQLWNSIPRSATSLQYAELLLKIDPSLLNQVISNKLEGHTLTSIISAVDQYLLPEGFVESTCNILTALSGVSRFSLVIMFLSAEEKKVLSRIFDKLVESSPAKKDKLLLLKGKYSF